MPIRRWWETLFLTVTVLTAAPLSNPEASTITVRQDGTGDYTTIQAAVAAAGSGDTVMVGPGTYTGPTISISVPLTLLSSEGADSTILDGEYQNQILTIGAVPAVITGVTFTRGERSYGSAIDAGSGGTVEVSDCRFLRNHGNAVYSVADLLLDGCYFDRNGVVGGFGTGEAVISHLPGASIVRCTFVENKTAIVAYASNISECLFVRNVAKVLRLFDSSTLQLSTLDANWSGVEVLENSTVTRNIISNTRNGAGLILGGGTRSCNLFWSNADGPIDVDDGLPVDVADPQYCDVRNGDYKVASTSPALSACGGRGRFGLGCSSSLPASVRITVAQSGPADFDNIQEALLAAAPGDTLVVGPGTYPGPLVADQDVVLRSTHGREATVLDGENTVRVLEVRLLPVLVDVKGFTIVNSVGCYIHNGRLVATDCLFTNNGTITHYNDSNARTTFTGCRFEGNPSVVVSSLVWKKFTGCQFIGNDGPVLYCSNSSLLVSECLFVDNTSTDRGAAIGVGYHGHANVYRSTFHNNHSPPNTATIFDRYNPQDHYLRVEGCIFSGETGGWALESPDIAGCNLFWDNAQGSVMNGAPGPTDIVADPQFCGALSGDFTVAETSPAAPQGNPCGELIGAYPVGCTEVPTLISIFRAEYGAGGVRLAWELVSDDVLIGFRVARYDAMDRRVKMLPETGFLAREARGFLDESVQAGREYEYTLLVARSEGDDIRSAPVRVNTPAVVFSLSQNSPNPFHPRTSITYALGTPAEVRLEVFTVDGRRVRTLTSAFQGVGTKTVTWDGRDADGRMVASGVYFYRLRAGGRTFTRKMNLLR